MILDDFNLDINECNTMEAECSKYAECVNNEGSYTCLCKVGFTGNGNLCTGGVL